MNDFSYVNIRELAFLSLGDRIDVKIYWRTSWLSRILRGKNQCVFVSDWTNQRPRNAGKTTRGIPLNFWSPDAVLLLPRGEQIFWGSSYLSSLAQTFEYIHIHAAPCECLVSHRMCTPTCLKLGVTGFWIFFNGRMRISYISHFIQSFYINYNIAKGLTRLKGWLTMKMFLAVSKVS